MNEQSVFNSPGSKFLISFKGSNTAVASWDTIVFQVPPIWRNLQGWCHKTIIPSLCTARCPYFIVR